jgi:hypothetical protein
MCSKGTQGTHSVVHTRREEAEGSASRRFSASAAPTVLSDYGSLGVPYCVCAAPTAVPGTPAPTNLGDTNPPTRAPTPLPTWGPNFADPTGTSDARRTAHDRHTTWHCA